MGTGRRVHVVLGVCLAGALAAGGVFAFTTADHRGAPVVVTRIAQLTATQNPGVCTVGGLPGSLGAGSRPVRVSANPVGATLVWSPGLNGPCRIASSTAAAGTARALAEATNSARRFPSGPINCASADGSLVLIYFRFAASPDLDLVADQLSGCGGVTAPNRANRAGDLPLPPSPLG